LPAFPDAEGFGRFATGGRGGDVYFVTNLNDDGPGSLRHGIRTARQPRTILFNVSGDIRLKSGLVVERPDLTLAGQSAPGDGICIRDEGVILNANNLVVRHLRFRLGAEGVDPEDALTINHGKHIMVDHCSASWSIDETLSAAGYADHVTVQWCYITESLNRSIHVKGEHGYGSLIRPRADVSYTFHHNLYAHHSSRVPRPGTYPGGRLLLDFRNNLLYDWGIKAGYTNYEDERVRMNYVGNYLQAGPSTRWLKSAFQGAGEMVAIFQDANRLDVNRNGLLDGDAGGWEMFNGVFTKVEKPFDVPPVATDPSILAYGRVLSLAGALPWRRDDVDARVTQQVLTGSGGIIDTTDQVGGWPKLISEQPAPDFDQDGMPDYWELAMGSDPRSADQNGDVDGNGYTNLEEYLNWLGAPHGLTETNRSLKVDPTLFTAGLAHPRLAIEKSVQGTASLSPDGQFVQFEPATNHSGMAGFELSAAVQGDPVRIPVRILVAPGRQQ
jgi:hypothetical protein